MEIDYPPSSVQYQKHFHSVSLGGGSVLTLLECAGKYMIKLESYSDHCSHSNSSCSGRLSRLQQPWLQLLQQ